MQMTNREKELAKRAGGGKHGEAFIRARRKRPGTSLREFEIAGGKVEGDEEQSTAAPPVEAAPVAPPAPAKKTTAAKRTAAKTSSGSTARK